MLCNPGACSYTPWFALIETGLPGSGGAKSEE